MRQSEEKNKAVFFFFFKSVNEDTVASAFSRVSIYEPM